MCICVHSRTTTGKLFSYRFKLNAFRLFLVNGKAHSFFSVAPAFELLFSLCNLSLPDQRRTMANPYQFNADVKYVCMYAVRLIILWPKMIRTVFHMDELLMWQNLKRHLPSMFAVESELFHIIIIIICTYSFLVTLKIDSFFFLFHLVSVSSIYQQWLCCKCVFRFFLVSIKAKCFGALAGYQFSVSVKCRCVFYMNSILCAQTHFPQYL